jgi:hypothetical protein
MVKPLVKDSGVDSGIDKETFRFAAMVCLRGCRSMEHGRAFIKSTSLDAFELTFWRSLLAALTVMFLRDRKATALIA